MAWGWYIPLGLLALAILLSLLRVKVRCVYDGENGLRLHWAYGPVHVQIYPASTQPKKAGDKPAKARKRKQPAEPKKPARKLTVTELLDYGRFGVAAAGDSLRALRVDELTLHARIGTEDAAQTALAYGAASAAMSALYPALASRTRIVRQDLLLEADFTGGQSLSFCVQVSGMVLHLSISGIRVLFGLIKLQRQHRKAVSA